jgi:hypothetical protein
MILLVHLLLGALIGQKISNPILAIVLAFLSHYFLDFIPHIEYPLKEDTKNWNDFLSNALKIFLDFCLGILLILIFSKNQLIIYICAFLAILPDGFTVLSHFIPNKILEIHSNFHTKKIHFLKYNPVEYCEAAISPSAKLFNRLKKISNFWRIISQIMILIISVILLRY